MLLYDKKYRKKLLAHGLFHMVVWNKIAIKDGRHAKNLLKENIFKYSHIIYHFVRNLM